MATEALQQAAGIPRTGVAARPRFRKRQGPERRRVFRVLALLAAVLVMGLADLEMTLAYATTVGFAEANPVARWVMNVGSVRYLAVFKLTTMSIGLGILYWARKTPHGEVGAWACFLAMAWLSVHWHAYNRGVSEMTHIVSDLADADDPRWVTMSP